MLFSVSQVVRNQSTTFSIFPFSLHHMRFATGRHWWGDYKVEKRVAFLSVSRGPSNSNRGSSNDCRQLFVPKTSVAVLTD